MTVKTANKDLFGDLIIEDVLLRDKFIAPPFSVLDARQGYWQKRKKTWLALGIQSELGRGRNTLDFSASAILHPITNIEERNKWNEERRNKKDMIGKSNLLGHPDTTGDLTFYKQKRETEARIGREITTDEFRQSYYVPTEGEIHSGTSIFDPVLCELVYRWFCPKEGKILDPFAGGSVRGIVAGYLGYDYIGIELRPEQVGANRAQADVCDGSKPRWIVGDSQKIENLVDGKYDFIFSCPPYYDLEIYSDLEGEMSALLTYKDFVKIYRDIIKKCVVMLEDNRFACFVVGDIRDKQGFYRNFVSNTISAFQEAGMLLYNEAILVTAVGSLPIRVPKIFESSRKLGKTHQNVLIFYKGDIKKIKENYSEVEVTNLIYSEEIDGDNHRSTYQEVRDKIISKPGQGGQVNFGFFRRER